MGGSGWGQAGSIVFLSKQLAEEPKRSMNDDEQRVCNNKSRSSPSQWCDPNPWENHFTENLTFFIFSVDNA